MVKVLFRKKAREERSLIDEGIISDALIRGIRQSAYVTEQQAIEIPAFSACINFIASSIAMLPLKLYTENNLVVEEIPLDYRLRLLNDETGDLLTPCDMLKSFIRDYMIFGAGYIYVNRELNKIKSLHYVRYSSISVNLNTNPIFKQAEILVQGNRYNDFSFLKIVRNTGDGVRGKGVVEENGMLLSSAYNSLKYENALVKSGGNKKGFLQADKKVSQEVLESIRNAWRELYANNENNVMVLNDGLKFQESSNNSVELQLNESKQTNTEQLCSIFLLAPNIISGKASADEYVAAFKIACMPIVKQIETELNKILLLETEKPNKYFAFDLTETLKGDILKRYQAYQIGLQGNFLQPDEVRYKEDLEPLGLDFIKLGLNDVLYNPVTHQVYTPNTNKTTDINNNIINGGDDDEN